LPLLAEPTRCINFVASRDDDGRLGHHFVLNGRSNADQGIARRVADLAIGEARARFCVPNNANRECRILFKDG
jgi:hypothetical protein